MRFLKMMLAVFLICLLSFPAFAEETDIGDLTAIAMQPETEDQILDLYCGPTQGFYRHDAQILDTGKPYTYFGQYDCWAMVAQNRGDDFGPIGWVEAGAIPDIPYEPQLAFEDGFAAMIEDPAPLTNDPLAENPFEGWTLHLEAGTQIVVLAQLNDWLYIQAEVEDTPIRAFIQMDTVF